MECTCRWLRDSAALTNLKGFRFGAQIFGVILALVLVGIAAPPAFADPVFQCANDAQGANDVPGQKDLTRACVAPGSGNYELYTKWNWDIPSLSGGTTAHACWL